MSKRGRGHLSPEDRALWDKVAKTTTPLEKARPNVSRPPKFAKPEIKSGSHPAWYPEHFEIGSQTKRDDAVRAAKKPVSAPLRMDRGTFQRMRRGKQKPDARIDLHGMTVAVAHPALTSFVMRSHAEGHRLLLVITGKGRGGEDNGPIPVRRGILRQQVPHWLSVPPLASIVLQVEQAHDRHGGSGAFYVYLRRRA